MVKERGFGDTGSEATPRAEVSMNVDINIHEAVIRTECVVDRKNPGPGNVDYDGGRCKIVVDLGGAITVQRNNRIRESEGVNVFKPTCSC